MVQWVIPDCLAQSARPGYPSKDIHRTVVDEWLTEVRSVGIKSIICLLTDEHLKLYRGLPDGCNLIGYYRNKEFEVAHIPALDHLSPPLSVEDLERIEAAYLRLPKPVLIHCSAGIDRTGLAVRFLQAKYRNNG